jgi:Holliday junction DNA helicase RuvA
MAYNIPMISMLEGKVELVRDNWAIINVNGVGYRINIGSDLAVKLHPEENTKLYIYTQVREEILALYAFPDIQELEFFEQLLTVSGIGPKAAQGILSAASVEKVKASIINQDPTLISSVSGIGKKTAEKVVIELKNKVGSTVNYFETNGGRSEEVYEALLQLGFKPNEARQALADLPESCKTTEERLKYCLGALNRG